MDVPKELVFNYLMDFGKKEINLFERAKLINALKAETCMSYRELGRAVHVSHVRLNEWANWGHVDEKKYKILRDRGLSNRAIFKELFTDRMEDKEQKKYITRIQEKESDLDIDLKRVIDILERHCSKPKKSENTEDLLTVVERKVNHIKFRIEK